MVSWEGQFGWQEYALAGRPDFLNYLKAGDVTWESLWEFYRSQPPSEEALRAVARLFHLFHSSEYDRAGCWLDPDGEVYARVRAWSEFVLDGADRIDPAQFCPDLAGLVGAGLVTPLYYQAVYLVFTETSVDRLAAVVTGGPVTRQISDLSAASRADGSCLPMYHPGPNRYPDLLGDPVWSNRLQDHLEEAYEQWNGLYLSHLPDPDEAEAWMTVGGEA